MLTCTQCQALFLDDEYGLLEASDREALQAHLTGCEACRTAREKAGRWRNLIATAAKTDVPAGEFVAPAEKKPEPKTPTPTPGSISSRWIGWFVAASLLLTGSAIVGPSVKSLVGYYSHKPSVDRALAEVQTAQQEREQLAAQLDDAKRVAQARFQERKSALETITSEWLKTEDQMVALRSTTPVSLEVLGPSSVIPGAPNDYRLQARDRQGNLIEARMRARVADPDGKVYFQKELTATPGGTQLTLPANIWGEVPSAADLRLQVELVSANGIKGNSGITETLRLYEPIYTTFLATDKPMYRPGETVYFRSLTLDRARFQPPPSDLGLHYSLRSPEGNPVPGFELTGLAKGITPQGNDASLVTGPDGKPVRGVGTGAFRLPAGLPGGEYTLTVTEIARKELRPRPNTKPLAVRKFIVNNYTPDKIDKKLEWDAKSYGPGDVVQARLEVLDQAKPLAGAQLEVVIDANGALITPESAPATTNAQGVAAIRFRLPQVDEVQDARLSITVRTASIVETIVKRVPLVSRRVNVEFFPEGGELLPGVANRVYFRAMTANGKPADIQGIITDGVQTVAEVKTLTDPDQPGVNQGLGVFSFTPTAGRSYALQIAKPTGLIAPSAGVLSDVPAALFGTSAIAGTPGYLLPKAKAQGVLLTTLDPVTRAGSPIRLRLTAVGGARSVMVGAYTRGRPLAHTSVKLNNAQPTEVVLDPGSNPIGGVTRITVFEVPEGGAVGRDDLKPLAERLVFRHAGEFLKFNTEFRRPGNSSPVKGFTPGESVELGVTVTNEAGQPTPAIVWAGVTSQNVITMADEKTARLMPTFFYLTGEVQKGEDLEHSDFLLTDHPKAAQTLDLLLGTQGWRRFAEQAPELFRSKVPAAEADEWQLVAAGKRSGNEPIAATNTTRRIFDEFWPRYEAAVLELEAAEAAMKNGSNIRGLEEQVQNRTSQHTAATYRFSQAAGQLSIFDEEIQTRRMWLPFTLCFLVLLGGTYLGLRFLVAPRADERRVLRFGFYGLGALTLFVVFGAVVTALGDRGWRSIMIPSDNRQITGRQGSTMRFEAPASAPAPAANAPANMDIDEVGRVGAKENVERFGGMGGGMPGAGGPGGPGVPFPAGGAAVRPPGGPGFAPPPPPGAMAPAAPLVAEPVELGMLAKKAEAAKDQPADKRMMLRKEAKQRLDEDRKAMDHEELGMNGIIVQEQAIPGRAGVARPDAFMWKEKGGVSPTNEKMLRRLTEIEKNLVRDEAKSLSDARARGLQFGRIRTEMPRLPALIVREYAHTRKSATSDDSTRSDFTETVLWQPLIVLPQDGKTTLRFQLSDAIQGYQVMLVGHTLDGRIGAIKETLEVRKPFAVDPKLPVEISSSDKIDLPVILTNAAPTPETAMVKLGLDGWQVTPGNEMFTLPMSANGGARRYVRIAPTKPVGPLAIQAQGTAGQGLTDQIERTTLVTPDGFPVRGGQGDALEQRATIPIKLPTNRIPGTLQVRFTVYPNTLTEIQDGLEGLLQEPYGCFEQSSTTNYPNVLILNYLNETNKARPEVSKRARELLDRGYARLTGYECPETPSKSRRGYEWFGAADRPHEALTAYGLLQFTDMARVYPVDPVMLQRTRSFLVDRRDGKGGFQRNAQALDSFGRAPEAVTNAYIVWAITESERTSAEKTDLTKELVGIRQSSEKDKDPYVMALTAIALLNTGDRAAATPLLDALVTLQAQDGSIPGAQTSITMSSGQALTIETTALATLGWLKAERADKYALPVRSAITWIGKQRQGGAFGSTQSTILALRALIEHARQNKRPAEDGELRFFLGDREIVRRQFTTESSGPITVDFTDPDALFPGAGKELRVETTAKQVYPYVLDWSCRTPQPDTAPDGAIDLTTSLTKSELKEGEATRVDVRVVNRQDRGQGMVVAIVGIPAGMKIPEDRKQLRQLTEKGPNGTEPLVSFWETRGRELILYWRGMAPKQSISVGIDLIAEVPGEYHGPASRAYLYYTAEKKTWVPPMVARISPASTPSP